MNQHFSGFSEQKIGKFMCETNIKAHKWVSLSNPYGKIGKAETRSLIYKHCNWSEGLFMEGLVDSYKYIEIISPLCREIKKKMKLKAGKLSLVCCHAAFLPALTHSNAHWTCLISIHGAGTKTQRIPHSPVSTPKNPYFRVPQNHRSEIDQLVRREIRSSPICARCNFLTFPDRFWQYLSCFNGFRMLALHHDIPRL